MTADVEISRVYSTMTQVVFRIGTRPPGHRSISRCPYRRNGIIEKMKTYKYSVIFEPCARGGYNVLVPAIPEICTFGKTLDEAKEMAREAIRCFLESAGKCCDEIPPDFEPSIEKITVSL
jgi:antitoxin HicB